MNDEHSSMVMNAVSMVQNAILQEMSGYGEPSAIYRPKVFRDGNLWCALYGDNIQEGVCGFGDTPAAAIYDFNQCWYGLGKYKKKRINQMKLHRQEITIKVSVPEGYHVSKVNPEQAVVPRLAECLEVDYNTIADIITARITIKKDV